MTELTFKGKEFVYNHHLSVPFRPLVPHADKGIGAVDLDGNLIIQGDNLNALKALLPRYAGKVDCIFIDPPYNTGNEGWAYNDNVNAPMIKEWLEANPIGIEDGLRHDKWCTMMWPRLRLLQELLAEDGFIAICIDENEIKNLLSIMSEIFRNDNQRAIVSRLQKKQSANDGKGFSNKSDYVVIFSKNPIAEIARIALTEDALNTSYREANEEFPLSRWQDVSIRASSGHQGGGYEYSRITPSGKLVSGPWLCPPETYDNLKKLRRLYFGKKQNSPARRVMYDFESEGRPPNNLWLEAGTNAEGKNEILEIFGGNAFATPKPTSLVNMVLEICAPSQNALILDSFAGSGTTAHAVLEANRRDGGNRKFILVEMEDYADKLTAERVRRVINGYEFTGTQKTELLRKKLNWKAIETAQKLVDEVGSIENLEGLDFDKISKTIKNNELIVTGEKSVAEKTEGLGGSFTYCTLGDPVELDKILTGKSLPPWQALGSILFHMATNQTLDAEKADEKAFYLGETPSQHVWLIYRDDLDWLKSPDAALTLSFARNIAQARPGKTQLVFAPSRFVSQKLLTGEGLDVEFVPLPFALYRIERE